MCHLFFIYSVSLFREKFNTKNTNERFINLSYNYHLSNRGSTAAIEATRTNLSTCMKLLENATGKNTSQKKITG